MKASFEQRQKIEMLIKQYCEHHKKNFLLKGTTSIFGLKKNNNKPQNFELAL